MDDDGSCNVTFSNQQFWKINGNFPSPFTQGGPTPTNQEPPGSPSIGAGNPALCQTVDQRFFAVPAGSACDIGSYDIAATQDTTPPTCVVTNLIIGPPKQQQVTVTDPGSGMGPEAGGMSDPAGTPGDAISNVAITNGTVAFTPFTAPSRSGLVLTATKTNQATATRWNFTATDWAGNSKFCT